MKGRLNLYGHVKLKEIIVFLPILIAVLYINLGLIPLKGDEAIRATVALEMMLAGNYVTPTLAGELYLNKPPLYNWILIGFFRLFNNDSEFIVRLPTTLFLILYCLTIFYFFSKELGRQTGILSALAFLTCARILFWDSFLGLIDIAYSWITFTNFMVIWHFFRKRQFLSLFVISYALTAVTFLMKGLPSVVFQGLTLLVIFIQHGMFKRLFSLKHIAGLIVFVLLLLPYYTAYYLQNPEYLDNALLKLITESTDKSAIGSGLQKTLVHIFVFPFELIRHFVPWIVLVIFLFHKEIFRKLTENEFIRYCFLVTIVNIAVYWLSPTTYPRYLLMLMPMAFAVFLYAGKFHAFLKTMNYRVVQYVIVLFTIGLIFSSIVLPVYFSAYIPVSHIYLKTSALVVVGSLLYLVLKPFRAGLFYAVVMITLFTRISFNLFLQPYRESVDILTTCRNEAIELAQNTRGAPLYYMTDTITIHNVYYLTRERDEILTYRDKPDDKSFFIVDDSLKPGASFKRYFSMHVPYYFQTYYAGKFEN